MVRRVIQIVYKEIRGLHQAAYVLALFTFGSQILALIRDRLLAGEFGAGAELDLYYAAFRIPDLLYVLFASTLSVYVLIPFVAERMRGGGSERARALLSQIFTLFILFYVVLALALAVFAPYIVPLVFPGLAAQSEALTLLIRILLLQPLLLGLSSLFGVVTQLGHRFVLYALSPVIYNLGIIFGLLALYPFLGIPGLVLGVVIGAIGHLCIQLPFILKSSIRPRISFAFEWHAIREVLTVSIPRALTLSLHQFVLLGLVGFATIMAEGSVSVFQFAFNLQSVPLAIIGVSYSVAAFPLLAQLHADGKMHAFADHILTALRHIIFWSVPVIALIVVIRAQIVRVVLGTGAFDWDDTRLTAAVLALFALSLVAQAVNLLFIRALYAVGNTRLPFYITLFSSIGVILTSLVLYILFVTQEAFRNTLEQLLRLEGVAGTEVVVLALGYTLVLLVHSTVLIVLSQKVLHFNARHIVGHLARALFAGLLGGIVAYATLNLFVEGLRTETLVGIFIQGTLAGGAGILAAIAGYALVRSSELAEVYRAFHRKIFSTEVVAPQDEDHLAV